MFGSIGVGGGIHVALGGRGTIEVGLGGRAGCYGGGGAKKVAVRGVLWGAVGKRLVVRNTSWIRPPTSCSSSFPSWQHDVWPALASF